MSGNGDEPPPDGTVGGPSGNGRDPPDGDGNGSGPTPPEDHGGTGQGAPGPGSPDPTHGGDGDPPWAFEEVQRFRQPWLWALVAAVSAFAVVTVAVQRPGPLLTALLLGLPLVGIPGTYLAKLRTEVREDGLYVRLAPLHRSARHVPFGDIEDHETLEFSALRDYGGVGIRRTPGGWAYVVTGGGGVRIDRGEDEPAIVLGSARPRDLDRALAAGVARARANAEGFDGPRWKAVADFQNPAEGGGGRAGDEGSPSGGSLDADSGTEE